MLAPQSRDMVTWFHPPGINTKFQHNLHHLSRSKPNFALLLLRVTKILRGRKWEQKYVFICVKYEGGRRAKKKLLQAQIRLHCIPRWEHRLKSASYQRKKYNTHYCHLHVSFTRRLPSFRRAPKNTYCTQNKSCRADNVIIRPTGLSCRANNDIGR